MQKEQVTQEASGGTPETAEPPQESAGEGEMMVEAHLRKSIEVKPDESAEEGDTFGKELPPEIVIHDRCNGICTRLLPPWPPSPCSNDQSVPSSPEPYRRFGSFRLLVAGDDPVPCSPAPPASIPSAVPLIPTSPKRRIINIQPLPDTPTTHASPPFFPPQPTSAHPRFATCTDNTIPMFPRSVANWSMPFNPYRKSLPQAAPTAPGPPNLQLRSNFLLPFAFQGLSSEHRRTSLPQAAPTVGAPPKHRVSPNPRLPIAFQGLLSGPRRMSVPERTPAVAAPPNHKVSPNPLPPVASQRLAPNNQFKSDRIDAERSSTISRVLFFEKARSRRDC